MSPKTRESENVGSFIERLYERGGARVNQVLEELLKRPGVTDRLGQTVGRAAEAKRQIDRNMQLLLSLLNLPSRGDYNRILAKIETLQGSLVNLNMKLDRVLAAQQGHDARQRGGAKSRGRAKSARRSR